LSFFNKPAQVVLFKLDERTGVSEDMWKSKMVERMQCTVRTLSERFTTVIRFWNDLGTLLSVVQDTDLKKIKAENACVADEIYCILCNVWLLVGRRIPFHRQLISVIYFCFVSSVHAGWAEQLIRHKHFLMKFLRLINGFLALVLIGWILGIPRLVPDLPCSP